MATALGCGSDVQLPLDLERGANPPPSDSPESDSPPESAPPLGQLAWSRTEFDDPAGYVHDLVWAADGGVLATAPMVGTEDDGYMSVLTRHEPDGSLDWDVHSNVDDFLGMLSPTADGGAVVAMSPDDWTEEGPNRPAGLDWYDGDGNLVRSWRAGEGDTEDTLREIDAVQTLPDGRVFWAGQTLNDDFTKSRVVAGQVDTDGQLEWAVTVQSPVDGPFYSGQPTHATLAADGTVLMLASYPITPGAGTYASYIVNYALDGSELWRTVFLGTGDGNGFEVLPSGNVVVAGNFQGSMGIGDLRLEGAPYGHNHFVAELDPAGQPLGLSSLELPAAIDREELGVIANTMSAVGEDVVVAGKYYTNTSNAPQLTGYYAATNRLDGSLAAELIFPVEVSDQFSSFGPMAADATPEGRLALGGAYSGRVDFGDGEVDAGPGSKAFIAVFDPMPADCGGDVLLIDRSGCAGPAGDQRALAPGTRPCSMADSAPRRSGSKSAHTARNSGRATTSAAAGAGCAMGHRPATSACR